MKKTILLWLGLLALVACGSNVDASSPDLYNTSNTYTELVEGEALEEAKTAVLNDGAIADETQNAVVQERLIIRNANLSLIVPDTETSLTRISDLAENTGGWVVNSNTNQYSTYTSGNITVRIPAEQFEAVLADIKSNATKVSNENISGQDVTEEYVDISSRLTNLQATAERVRGFLDETENVEEALAVNQELSRLNEQIEVLTGRLEFLSQSAAYSTISVDLTPDAANQPIQVAGWQPQGIARDAIEALVETLQGLANIIIWLGIYILPLFIIIVLPIFFLARKLWRRWRKRRTAVSPPPPPPTTT